MTRLFLLHVIFALALSSVGLQALLAAKEPTGNNQQQPLANLDKILRQANGVQMDAIMDNRLAANVSNALNDMALNLRKLFTENRKLSMQVQDVLNRVQNATGVNATKTLSNLQQANVTSLSNQLNLGNVVARMQSA